MGLPAWARMGQGMGLCMPEQENSRQDERTECIVERTEEKLEAQSKKK